MDKDSAHLNDLEDIANKICELDGIHINTVSDKEKEEV